MAKLLIAEQVWLYRRGLRAALESLRPWSAVLEANTLAQAIAVLIEEAPIDLCIFDNDLPDFNSFADLKDIRKTFQQTCLVVLSSKNCAGTVLQALGAGAHGVISKSQSEDEIVAALNDVLSGRIYVPPWLPQASAPHTRAASPAGERSALDDASLRSLTNRQRDVLLLIAEGMSNSEIADRLSIKLATTKIHVTNVLRILGVSSRTKAAILLKSARAEASAPSSGRSRSD